MCVEENQICLAWFRSRLSHHWRTMGIPKMWSVTSERLCNARGAQHQPELLSSGAFNRQITLYIYLHRSPVWGPLLGPLGHLWGLLGRSWEVLGASQGPLGDLLGGLGDLLGGLWGLLGTSWGIFGASWGILGGLWEPLGQSLGPLWDSLCNLWRHLGGLWGLLGAIWVPKRTQKASQSKPNE